MMCGSIEIDGDAFCLGLKLLKLPYTASPELQSIPSLTYLIERAGLRSKYTTNSLGRLSLETHDLAELIDMFHTRKATDVRDKVYALLGMSRDDPGKAGLRPDYEVSWKELFQQLVEFVLSKGVSVETSNYSQMAVIRSKGCILGQVSSVSRDASVTIGLKYPAWYSGSKMEWTLQASAKAIQKGDIVCLLQGASKPTIIRLYHDYFTVVIIAATPLNERGSFGKPELPKSIIHAPRDFLLIWDWGKPLGVPQDREEYESLRVINSQVLEHSKAEFGDHLDKAIRIWNVALVLGDLEEYKRAEEKLREAIEGYEIVFGKQRLYTLTGQYGLTPLSWAAGNGDNKEMKLLLDKDSFDPDLKDSQYSQTPLSWAAKQGHEAVVKLLLETGKVEVNSKDKYGRTPLSWAAERGHKAVIKLLLETGKVEVNLKDKYIQSLLIWAAERGHKAIVKLLLETSKVNVEYRDKDSQTPLSKAAEGGHEAVVKLLLEIGRVEVNSKDKYGWTPLSWAAKRGHEAVVKLLLETGKVKVDLKDEDGRTLLSWVAEGRHEAVVKLLLETGKVEVDLKDKYIRSLIIWEAERGHKAVVKLLLEIAKAKVDLKDEDGRTLLSWAAEGRHEAVVKLLLETGKVEVDLKDEYIRSLIIWEAERGHMAMLKLLLEIAKAKVDLKDENGRTLLSWAAERGHEAVVKLLLETGKVKVDSKDNYGRTPLSLAAYNKHEAVVKLLQSGT